MEDTPRDKPPTLRDVASLAGVDPSVVSRLINRDDRLSISEATRKRVLEAIEEVGYRPNVTAKALRMGKSFLIGLLVPDFANPVYAEIIRGAQEAADSLGYGLILGSAEDATHGEDWLHRLVDAGRVDGMLFASATLEDPHLAEIAESDRRILVLNRLVPGVRSAVVVDDSAGSRLAAKHLVELGHRRIGIVAGPKRVETTRRRIDGVTDVARRAGLREPVVTYTDAVSAESGFDAARRLIDDHPDVTAIFASTLIIGLGVLKSVLQSGRAVPGDISVIALNDGDLARYVNPGLTTVAMPYRAMGRVAIEELLTRIGGEGEEREIVVNDPPPHLMARESTGTAPETAR